MRIPPIPARARPLLCALGVAASLLPVAVTTGRAQADATLPVLHRGGRTDVLLHAPSLADPARDAARLSALVRSCRADLPISPADSAAIARLASPGAGGAGVASETITISLLPVHALQPRCGDDAALGTLAASRGLRIAREARTADSPSVSAAVVSRHGRELTPLATERLPILRLAANGLESTEETWLRLTFSLDAFTYAVSGDDSGFTVYVETGEGSAPDEFAVPAVALRRLWGQLLPMRAARLRADGPVELELPEPEDPVLQRVSAAYRGGDMATAARLATERLLEGPSLSRMDRVYARTAAATAFAAGNDPAAAQVLWTDLLGIEPCFDLSSSAPRGALEALRSIGRPPARCTARSAWRTAATALVLPGFGRPNEPGRLLARSLVAASVVSTSVLAFSRNEDAKAAYDRYLAWNYTTGAATDPNPAVGFYNEAEDARQASLAIYRLSAALYVGQALWAVWAERRHRERLDAVNDYGETPRGVTLVPLGNGRSVGLAVSVTW